MIVYPAIDLRDGQVVQLEGGRPDAERVRLPDPVGQARAWVRAGFRAIHVVDLDAALGTGSNRDAVAEVIRAVDVPIQVGGGVRDRATVDALLELGAERVIVGTRAVEEPVWLQDLAGDLPDRVVVAADARDGRVVTRGWTEDAHLTVTDLVDRLQTLPLGGILVTDVSREGRLRGADVDGFAKLASRSRHRLIASGGITTLDELRRLSSAAVAGAVLGMALYTGTLDPAAVAAFDSTQEDT